MKQNYKLKPAAWLLAAFVGLMPSIDAYAQLQWKDNFDYPAGNLYKQGGWVKHGSNSKDPIQVADEKLEYAGYPSGVSGKVAKFVSTGTSGEDLVASFDETEKGVTSGTLYYSALINVSKLDKGEKTNSTAVMGLVPQSSSKPIYDGISSTAVSQLYIDEGSEAGKIKIGLGTNSSSSAQFATDEYNLNTTYLVVVKYEISASGNKASLFVNPSGYEAEPTNPTLVFDDATTTVRRPLQGIGLFQKGNFSTPTPDMAFGMLSVSDSYSGLFGEAKPDESPKISSEPKEISFGYVYEGTSVEQKITIKAQHLTSDISVSVKNTDEVKASAETIPAAEAMTDGGYELTLTLNPKTAQGSGVLSLSSQGAATLEIPLAWVTAQLTKIVSLNDFMKENPDDYLEYKYTGRAVVTFADEAAKTYYVQDATGAVTVKDSYEILSKSYKQGDVITGFVGNIESAWGAVSLIPTQTTLGQTLKTDSVATPITVTLGDIKASPKTYLNRLVKIENATLSGFEEGAKFENGMTQPVVKDAAGEGKLRIFKSTTLIGKDIPTTAQNIIGLSTSASAVIIGPRSADDLQEAVVAEPSLEILPAKLSRAEGKVGEKTLVGTVHVKAVNLPGNVSVYLTGKGVKQFAVSTDAIPAGTSEMDIDFEYLPTEIGEHTARVNFESIELPELNQAITLEGIAIDPANPPMVQVEAEGLKTFEAKAGEKAEQEFKVTTANLPQYAKLLVAGGEGAFVINTTMLLKNNVSPVKVTFSPKKAGDYNATIKLFTYGVDTIYVKVVGKATDVPTIPEAEGDLLPLDDSKPMSILTETFDSGIKNKPLALEGWKNLALEGTRAWWGYELADGDVTEKVAKVTPYDSKVDMGSGTPCTMMLVTPALDFKNAASPKIFTFRVRGDYLRDDQTDKLTLCYVLKDGDSIYAEPVGGFNMPATEDVSGEWQEYHIDLTNQNIEDVFFMGFKFQSTRGRENSVTYYIDDVTFGHEDIPYISLSSTSIEYAAQPATDAVLPAVKVTASNLTEDIKLSLGGANKSKFKLSAASLPAQGGEFYVTFNSTEIGLHEAYVKLSSRGAADIYLPITVDVATSISGVDAAQTGEVTVYDVSGRIVLSKGNANLNKQLHALPSGVYVVKANGKTSKIRIK